MGRGMERTQTKNIDTNISMSGLGIESEGGVPFDEGASRLYKEGIFKQNLNEVKEQVMQILGGGHFRLREQPVQRP